MNKEWSELNKTLQTQIKKESSFAEGIDTLLILRQRLMEELVCMKQALHREDFNVMPFPNVNGYHSKTIAYSIWHIFRIEDIVAHSLMQNSEEIFWAYRDKIGAPIITTGNELIVFRQPFPGPGLGIRIIGEITAEKVKIVQDADYIYREEIAKVGLDKNINQYFACLTNMRSVGVMGDERTYDYAIVLRAVKTVDFMTAEAADIPFDVLQTIMSRIINEVRGVNRVFYDITSKPPGTIEFE